MKKIFATLGIVGLLTLNLGTVVAAGPAPTITSVTPSSGPTSGGTTITINGSHLDSVTVTIGGTAATNVVIAPNSQSLTATTPSAGPAAEDVVVANANGSATLEAGFTYTNGTTTGTTTYTLSYAAGTNGSITGSSTQVVASGSNGTAVTAVPASGYQFVNWSDSSTSNPRTDTSVSGNLSATANFQLIPAVSIAPCNGSTFDDFATGTVNGQNGWHVSGDFDQEVVSNEFGFLSFGCKSLRISDATTSVFIFNQTFSSPGGNEAGETDAVGGDTPIGTRQNRFEAQFDLASVSQNEQPGMHLSVSPDRGDGTRMSAIAFADTATGIDVFFDDVTGTTSPVSFHETQIATGLSRTTPHTIKYMMDFVDGPSNDIVKVFIDGTLVHTGTSWENFYRYDNDAFPAPNNKSRTVTSLVFYEQGTASSTDKFKGYLIDNVALSATTTSATTTPPAATSSAPVITLNGSSTMSVLLNGSFTDPGATATDDVDGTVAVTATGTVNTVVVGSYTITYSATDSHSNTATTTRTVNVTGPPVATSSIPVITLNGSSSVEVLLNTAFTDPGATATDDIDGTLTVTATGTVNTNALGDYTITYSATDSNNNVGTTTRVVHVVAGTASSGGGGSSSGGSYFIYLPATTGQNAPTPSSPITVGSIVTPTGQVLGVSIFNFSRNLKFGSQGDDVTELQKILMAGGYLQILVPTKYFGKLTEKALMKWQKQNKLPSTGYFGALSRALIAK